MPETPKPTPNGIVPSPDSRTDLPRRTATPPLSLPPLGPYELLEKLGEGGMGVVYKGLNRTTNEIVAVKVMNAELAKHPVLLKRFEQEFRTASRLDHPNIVRAIDYGESGGRPYLVMEFVPGESLATRVQRDGPIEEKAAIRLIAQVAQGLHRAHKQKLIHRDVKPDNILVTADGTAKLADLGLVKEIETDLNLTRTGKGLGTLQYMAPEQFRNAKNADVRCDIYSLAATLYVLVTGRLPFHGEPLEAWLKKVGDQFTKPRTIVPTLSRRIDRAIRRALSADPRLRPATCREFIEDVTGHSTRREAPAPEASSEEVWFVAYVDPARNLVTLQATVSRIRRALEKRALGDPNDVRVSRAKTGPFSTLHAHPEFRDLVVAPPIQVEDDD